MECCIRWPPHSPDLNPFSVFSCLAFIRVEREEWKILTLGACLQNVELRERQPCNEKTQNRNKKKKKERLTGFDSRSKDQHQIRHRDTIEDWNSYRCVSVSVLEREWGWRRRGGGWEGVDMMIREGSCELYWCSNGVPHIRQSPALFNALQIALPCALRTPIAHHRCAGQLRYRLQAK